MVTPADNAPERAYQPRWLAYCRAAGASPEHPGQGAAYIAWIGQRWQEWEAETGHTGPKRTEDHEAFDAWLVRLTMSDGPHLLRAPGVTKFIDNDRKSVSD